jgi:hypothetical protein
MRIFDFQPPHITQLEESHIEDYELQRVATLLTRYLRKNQNKTNPPSQSLHSIVPDNTLPDYINNLQIILRPLPTTKTAVHLPQGINKNSPQPAIAYNQTLIHDKDDPSIAQTLTHELRHALDTHKIRQRSPNLKAKPGGYYHSREQSKLNSPSEINARIVEIQYRVSREVQDILKDDPESTLNDYEDDVKAHIRELFSSMSIPTTNRNLNRVWRYIAYSSIQQHQQ